MEATDGHPFWVDTDGNAATPGGNWIDAAELRQGQWLKTSDGRLVRITGTHAHDQNTTVYNLTVDNLHTYYVLDGNQSVLVHNDVCRKLPSQSGRKTVIVLGRRNSVDGGDINVARSWSGHEVLSLPKTGPYRWKIERNDEWVAQAITKRQSVYLASPLDDSNIFSPT